jgi:zinc/manganese transport system substrate-binding protein
MIMNRRTLILCALSLALAAPAAAKPRVVTTLPSLAAIAREVAGDLADVRALLGPGQDPHYADARPSLVVELSKADILIVNGLQLEDAWVRPISLQARNPKIQIGADGWLNASAYVPDRLQANLPVDRAMGDIHPGGNPHFLFDPRAGAQIARAIGTRLAKVDAANAATYRETAEHVAKTYEAFAEKERARFAKLDGRAVVTYHRSLSYLLDWLAIDDVIRVEPKPGIPPNPQHTAEVLKTMKSRGLKVIVQERYYPTKVSQTLAKLSKGRLVVLEGGADFAAGQTFLQHLQEVADALHDALAR